MIGTKPDERTLSVALLSIFPRVQPSDKFLLNMYAAFADAGSDNRNAGPGWFERLREWLAENVGLVVEDMDGAWTDYRIIDQKKYTVALLRYS